MDFDRVLKSCGNFGRYQFLLLMLHGYTNILSALHYFAQTIISFTPEHWCAQGNLTNFNISSLKQFYADQKLTSCELFNGTECYEWIYDYEQGYESITTELNWVCDHAHYSAIGQSFFFVGSVVGTIFFGFLADRMGRLPAMLAASLTGATGDFLTSFVHSLPMFGITRLLAGLSTDSLYYLMYIMVFEYLSPKRRTFGLNIISAIFFTMGLMASPWLAIWVGTWRKYLWIASLPALGVLSYPLLICESAQWLLTKQKYLQAVKCLKRVAAFNGHQVDSSIYVEFVEHYKEKMSANSKTTDEGKDTFLGMFRTPRLRLFTVILLIKSMIVTLSYDIMGRNMEGLGSSPFKLLSFTAITYLPAGLTIILFQNKIGRKGMACASLFGASLLLAFIGFLIAYLDPKVNALLLALMVGLGRFGVIVAYDAEAQYAAEIIPTSVRGRGMSNIHVVGNAFNFLSPYVIYLGSYYKPLPAIVISTLMLVGSALCLILPETLNKKLPETLSDGEQFGLNEKWFYFSCLQQTNDTSQYCESKTQNDSDDDN